MPDYPPVRRNIPSPPGPPAGKITKKPGAPKAKGAVRAKSGCYTCRIRRKKCDEQPNSQGSCQTCVRLRLQCLGFGAKRPEWMREPESVPLLREKIKTFLASQGMIKGHSGPGPRNSDQQPQILMLSDRVEPRSPPTPTLSAASSSDGHRSPVTSYVRDAEYSHIPLEQPSYNNSSLHSSNLQDMHHPHQHHHSQHHPQHSSSFVPSRGPSFPNDIMLHPYGPPASNVLPSSNSLVPSMSWLNSSSSSSSSPPSSYTLAPILSSNAASNSTAVTISPTVQSSFSSTYTQEYVVDEAPYPEENDQRPSIMIMVPDRHIELVRHYMVNVMKIQYLQADQSIGPFIYEMIERSTSARDAVCLLSSLHRHCVKDNYAGPVTGETTALISSADDTDRFYYRLKSSLLRKGGSYDEGEAMAGLHVVSSFLFSGGRGDWDAYLNVAVKYVQSVFEDSRYYGPADALTNCPETTRFIVKTTMWFDVLASVTQMRVPRFLEIYRTVFGPKQGAYIESTPSPELSMIPVMGCENHILLALAEISELSHWKEMQTRTGCLSMLKLVQRGMEIEQKYLQRTCNGLFPQDPYLAPPPGTAYADQEGREVYQRRKLTNDVFRASARVYLHTVLSGDYPSSPEISAAVTETIECLKRVSLANNASLSRSVVRSVVFGICICGCLTDQPSQQAFLRGLLEQQEVEVVGNVMAVRRLMEDVWRRRATAEGKKTWTVNWREVMFEGGRELLLV